MAISWKVSVSEQGNNSGNYSVSAKVTDDTKPIDHQNESVSVVGRMDTEEQKKGLLDALKQQYQLKVIKVDALALIESESKTYLEK